jgi:hypothetical protein
VAKAAEEMRTVQGQARAVGTAFQGMTGPMGNTAASADQLISSMAALGNEQMQADRATAAWKQSLSTLGSQLSGNSRLTALDKVAIADRVDALKASVIAEADAGASAGQLSKQLLSQRQALIQNATAAGASRKEVQALVQTYGLTPKLVETLIRLRGAEEAEKAAKDALKALNPFDGKKAEAELSAKDNAKKVISSAMKFLGLWDKEKGEADVEADESGARKAIQFSKGFLNQWDGSRGEADVEADESGARRAISFSKGFLNQWDSSRGEAEVDANQSPAQSAIQQAQGLLNSWDSAVADALLLAKDSASGTIAGAKAQADGFAGTYTAILNVVKTFTNPFGGPGGATGGLYDDGTFKVRGMARGGSFPQGGMVRGPGGPRDDKVGPVMLSDGEFVVNARSTSKYLAQLVQMNAEGLRNGGMRGMATGGRKGQDPTPGQVFSPADIVSMAMLEDAPLTISQLAAALEDMRDEAKDVIKAEKDLKKAREANKAVAKEIRELEKKLRGNAREREQEANRVAKANEKQIRKLQQSFGKETSKAEERRLKRMEKAHKREEKNLEQHHKRQERNQEKHLRAMERRQRASDKRLEKEEKALAKQREQLAKATQKWKEIQQELIAQAKAITDTIMANGAIFGGQGTSVSVAGMLAKLRASAQDAEEFHGYIRQIRGAGLDEDLIQQLLEQGSTPEGLAAAKALANASKDEIKQLNAQQARLEGVAGQIGQLGVNLKAGTNIDNRVTVNINGPIRTTDVDRLARELPKHVRKAVRVAWMP